MCVSVCVCVEVLPSTHLVEELQDGQGHGDGVEWREDLADQGGVHAESGDRNGVLACAFSEKQRMCVSVRERERM